MKGSGDEDDMASPSRGGRGEEIGKCSFEGVVGAKDVDVNDGLHSVGGEVVDRGEKVASCARATKVVYVSRYCICLGQ